MRVPPDRRKSFILLAVLTLGTTTIQCSIALAQSQPERFWLAGRYDGNRVLVYFEAVKFNGPLPSEAKKIPCPVAVGLFCPVELPASYIARFQKGPDAEHFTLGDKYDLLLDESSVITVTLTTLVGSESDEEVGNDSFIGALATVEQDKQDWLYFMKGYLAVRRHRELPVGAQDRRKLRTVYASLLDEPIRFNVQRKIVELLDDRMNTMVNEGRRRDAPSISPLFSVQQVRLADGTLRYYARAGWKTGVGPRSKMIYALGAWIAPLPTLHVQAVESAVGFQYLPELLNVIDLSNGKTAIIISQHWDEGARLSLLEYHDGVSLSHMRTLQAIGSAE